MTHVLLYGPKMAHGHDDNAAFVAMEEKLENEKKTEEMHHATAGRKNSLADKAKDIFHEVAEMTMELAEEVKEKIVGHVTDKDIANAAQKVADLKAELEKEQHQLKDIQFAALAAELTVELHEYEALKAKEMKAKNQEFEMEHKLLAAEREYIRLQSAQLTQMQSQKNKS